MSALVVVCFLLAEAHYAKSGGGTPLRTKAFAGRDPKFGYRVPALAD